MAITWWGKKVSLFSKLNFCFAKSDLRVWEDIWEKNGRKGERYRGKDFETCLCSKQWYSQQKKEERNWHLFRHTTRGCFLKVTIQQNLNMMCKIRENDGCLCRVKMLNFGSKTFKILEFIPWIDLLVSDIQHFMFRKDALFNFRFDEFTWPQHYGTPKFWPKISHSGKCVENLLTKVNMPRTLKESLTRGCV